jgi:DNA-binding NarL/FixJ family response regulator
MVLISLSYRIDQALGRKVKILRESHKVHYNGEAVSSRVAKSGRRSNIAMGSIAIIGEGNSLFGAGLRTMLHDSRQFSKIHQAKSYAEILEQLERFPSARLLTIDFSMPEMRDENRLRQLRLRYPSCCLVIVADSLFRNDILLALSAGAHGYIPTRLPFNEIADAFKAILSGKIFVPKEIAMVGSSEPNMAAANDTAMTAREREVMALVASGNSNKMIARFLSLSEGTVKAHIHASYRKLGVKNRVSAAAALAQTWLLFLICPFFIAPVSVSDVSDRAEFNGEVALVERARRLTA